MTPRQRAAQLVAAMHGGLVVSCQPVAGGPMDDDDTVVRMALAAVAGGACALRIEGVARLALVRAAVALPLVGIVKRELADTPVRITPWLQDVHDLATAGADMIAVDATARVRPAALGLLLRAIQDHQVLAMADASDEHDGMAAWRAGFDVVGTTLAGYVGSCAEPLEPATALVQRLAAQGCRVMAEGRYDTPERAARALQAGAWAVTVGSAITRLEVVTAWFVAALANSPAAAPTPTAQPAHQAPAATSARETPCGGTEIATD